MFRRISRLVCCCCCCCCCWNDRPAPRNACKWKRIYIEKTGNSLNLLQRRDKNLHNQQRQLIEGILRKFE